MAFLRNTWYVAMWAQDLEPGQVTQRVILDEPIALFRKTDGTVAAITDQCAHRFAPLSRGAVCGDSLQCPYHGLQYDAGGQCVVNPHGSGRITPALHLRSYPVVERHSILWIWMGDQPAEPTRIPDFSHLDDDAPGVVSKRDWMVIDVDYRLMADNLLDLSHVNFLHDGLLGHAGMIDAEVDIHEDDDGTLYVTRISRNVAPSMMFDLMYRNDGDLVDTWAEMRWNAPGCLRNHAGLCPPGSEQADGMTVIGSHLLTPVSERQMRYHIAAVQVGGPPSGETDEAIAERLSTMRHFAFTEQDRPMVEAQQRAYDRAADAGRGVDGGVEALKPVMLSIDAGPLRARRILAALIEAESRAVVDVAVSVR
jgi:phenylpropionate dioxygenase-like ring-hydroxylating dioxygenase large terminal subunit